jgi:AcrR family transcriptional regulator
MVKKSHASPRREDSLSRDRIVDAAIGLLDASGEEGLTFRALSERLATGPGAIYNHIAGKSELLTAAGDAIVERTLAQRAAGTTPQATIRALALGLFDAIDAHPWVGAALARAPGQLPVVRILECLGQQVRALGVREAAQWATVTALLSYILDSVATTWAQLDPRDFPFACGIGAQLRAHDDRADFLAGIDLILAGMAASPRR